MYKFYLTVVRLILLCLPLLFLQITTNSCSGDDTVPVQTSDDDGNDDGGGNDHGGDNGDDDSYVEYPYISEVGLFIFDGDDPLTDSEPVFSFSNDLSVILNPATACYLTIGKDEKYKKKAWILHLSPTPASIDIATDNSCFNESLEITEEDFDTTWQYNRWKVELTAPGVTLPEYSTEKWDYSQGSVSVNPSKEFYTDPHYGVLPKKVSFTFNNVRIGYNDENGVKKALRVHGIVEVTKHD